MNKPTLIIMAAGLGSRYGGLKQIAPVDNDGHIMMDFSLYDAKQAGFDKVVFVINPLLEQDFKDIIGKRIQNDMDVHYAFQSLDFLPAGFSLPKGRTKPWGTAHAVLSAKPFVSENFAVINADDYYGADAFKQIYTFLENEADSSHHGMVGYYLKNTLTENGSVARGICQTDSHNNLTEIIERTHVETRPGGGAYTEDGENFVFMPGDTIVSMNLWGFGLSVMNEIETRFGEYLKENLSINPLKCEYFLPLIPNTLIKEGKATVKVLSTHEKWYGVTYAEDMPVVKSALEEMKSQGKYPKHLWRDR